MVYCKFTNPCGWFTNRSTYRFKWFTINPPNGLHGLLTDLPTVLNILQAKLKIGLVGLLTNRHTGLNGLLQVHKPV